MKFYVVRHGKTEFNDNRLMQGWSDAPLLDESIEMAINLGKKFNENDVEISKVYSSDSFRTLNTSMKILEGMEKDLEIHHLSDIREFYFGEGEAKPIDEVWGTIAKHAGYESLKDFQAKHHVMERVTYISKTPAYRRAESLEQFESRIARGIERMIEESHDDDKILVVCHGLTILSILEYFGYDVVENTSFDNLSVSEIDVTNKKIISAGEVY